MSENNVELLNTLKKLRPDPQQKTLQEASVHSGVSRVGGPSFEERLLKRLTWAILAIFLLTAAIVFEGERVNSTLSGVLTVRSAFNPAP